MKSQEPLNSPSKPSSTRAILTTLLLLGSAGGLTMGGYAPDVQADATFDFMRLWRRARAEEAYRLAHPELASSAVLPRQDLVGPPIPARIVVARAAAASQRGGIGPLFGPEAFAGAMNTTVSLQGVVRGPNYRGAPLPNVGGVVPLPGEYADPSSPVTPDLSTSDVASELPDQRSIELSRLANPGLAAGASGSNASNGATTPPPNAAPSPLRLSLQAVRPRGGFRVGENVAVRLSSSVPSYAAILRVDAAGKASVAFKSPGPSTTFGCVIKTGPAAGSEYLAAVASVKPLNGADVAQALRTVGMTYASAAPSAEGGLEPAAAWTSVVNHAGSAFAAAPSGAVRWQRNEFAVTGTSYAVRVPQSVATAKKPAASPAKTEPAAPAAKPAAPAPAESVLPTEVPKPEPAPAESEPPKETPQTTPAAPSEKGIKWDLPPTTRRPNAKPKGASLELSPDTRDAWPSAA